MKIAQKIISTLFLLIIGCVLAVNMILLLPPVQTKLTRFAEKKLELLLSTEVKIGKIKSILLTNVDIRDVFIADQQGDSLLYANKIAVGLELTPLLSKTIEISNAQFIGVDLHLHKQSPHALANYQFLIDRFAPNSTESKPLDFTIKLRSIVLRNTHMCYRVEDQKSEPGTFSPHNINVSKINANIALNEFSRDSINATIKRFSIQDHSGFEIKNLSIHLMANREKATIKNFNIQLAQSKITIDSLEAHYPQTDSIKDLLESGTFKLNVTSENLYLSDFSPFLPQLSAFDNPMQLNMEASGEKESIRLSHFSLRMAQEITAQAELYLEKFTTPDQLYLSGKINTLDVTPQGIERVYRALNGAHPTPPDLLKGRHIQLHGDLMGRLTEGIKAQGELTTDIGALTMGMNVKQKKGSKDLLITGRVESSELKLNNLFAEPNLFGMAAFDLEIDIATSPHQKPTGKAQGVIKRFDYKNYPYRDIALKAEFNRTQYNGSVVIEDPNIDLNLEGTYTTSHTTPGLEIKALVNKIHLDKLNITSKFPYSNLSFSIDSKLSVLNQYDIYGHATINNLLFTTQQNRLYYRSIEIKSDSMAHNERYIHLKSDAINGEIQGNFLAKNIPTALQQIAREAFPSLIPPKKESKEENMYLNFMFDIAETSALTQTLKLPFLLSKPVKLFGTFDNKQILNVELHAPDIRIGNTQIRNSQLFLFKEENKINLITRAGTESKTGKNINLFVEAKAHNDSLFTKLLFDNTSSATMSGELKTVASFYKSKENGSLQTVVDVLPAQFIIGDTVLTVNQSKITLNNESVYVNHFAIDGKNQHLRIDGCVSKNNTDTLSLSLKDISLDYIFDIVQIKNISFGGDASGDIKITNLYEAPRLFTNNLLVNRFIFNDAPLGHVEIESHWDNNKMAVHFEGEVRDRQDSLTTVKGFYQIPNDSLVLDIAANNLNIVCLHPFLDQILKKVEGTATGRVLLYGPSKYLSLKGWALAHQVSFGIDVLGTRYSFSDTIQLNPNGISLHNIKAFDIYGNYANVHGEVNYRYFTDLSFKFDIQTDKLYAYENYTKEPLPIIGSIFASGDIKIEGDESVVNISANVRPEIGSTMSYSISDNTKVSDYQYITFVTPKEVFEEEDDRTLPETTSAALTDQSDETIVNLTLDMDINPNLAVDVVMDETTGDVIKATGNGNIQMEYSTRNDELKTFGTYSIDRGNYSFSLQNVINKRFLIKEGSTIRFNGKNFSSISLDVNAAYTVTANLSDLDESFQTELSRTTMPVQCLMNISGNISKPNLTFGVNIPNVSSELNRRVKSLISSEDMMNRQIIYLLVLGKFYTPNYMTVANSSRTGEMAALASSALSSQLNNLLGKMIDNWNIGTNFRSQKGDFSDLEVELALSGQLLNNRLLINGNFGYRDKSINLTQTSFIGDIDVEYVLTKSGAFRLKGYTHTNDRPFYYKSALTTQGLGFAFKKEINTIRLPFRRKGEKVNQTEINKQNAEAIKQQLRKAFEEDR